MARRKRSYSSDTSKWGSVFFNNWLVDRKKESREKEKQNSVPKKKTEVPKTSWKDTILGLGLIIVIVLVISKFTS